MASQYALPYVENSNKNDLQQFIEETMKLEGIQWCAFTGIQDDVHVIPIDTDGNNFECHVPTPMCSCKPKLKEYEEGDVRFMFTHNLKTK